MTMSNSPPRQLVKQDYNNTPQAARIRLLQHQQNEIRLQNFQHRMISKLRSLSNTDERFLNILHNIFVLTGLYIKNNADNVESSFLRSLIIDCDTAIQALHRIRS
jgi:hypothetical protein